MCVCGHLPVGDVRCEQRVGRMGGQGSGRVVVLPAHACQHHHYAITATVSDVVAGVACCHLWWSVRKEHHPAAAAGRLCLGSCLTPPLPWPSGVSVRTNSLFQKGEHATLTTSLQIEME